MSIQLKINEALKAEQAKERKHSGKYWLSSLGRCYRYQYWQRKEEKPSNPPDERALRIFKCGSLFHDFVQGFVPEHTTEQEVENDDFKGRADIITTDEVIEIKSQHSNAFHYMRKEGYDINKEREANILQLMAYAWLLGKTKGRLIFVSKDDLCIVEYVFFLDKWKDKLQHEIDLLRHYWDKQILPETQPRAYGGKEGNYCPYKDKCKEYEIEHKRNIGDCACFKEPSQRRSRASKAKVA